MDIFLPIIIFLFLFIIFSICGYCCKRKRDGVVYRYGGTGVTVTTASPVVVPPYPVDARHPLPQTVQTGPPVPGFVPAQAPQQTTHMMYPPAGSTPYPPPPGVAPYSTGSPYPPTVAPYPPQSGAIPPYTAPPSYTEAMSHLPAQPPPTAEIYSKQSPYNPNF